MIINMLSDNKSINSAIKYLFNKQLIENFNHKYWVNKEMYLSKLKSDKVLETLKIIRRYYG
jgi:hypothetical protein